MLFKYKALKKDKVVHGKLEAASDRDAVLYLKKNGYFPIEVKKNDSVVMAFNDVFSGRISFNHIVDMTRQLAIMLNAGLTLIDSFNILEKQTTNQMVLKLLQDIDRDIRGGSTFSESLKKYPQYFSNLYISLVKAGEASGKLSDILAKLAENLEKQREFKGKLRATLAYPMIVIAGVIVVMFIMVTFVLPKLLDLYKNFNIDLPFQTKVLIFVSNFSAQFWPIIILGTVGIVFLIKNYLKTPIGRYTIDSTMLKLPGFGNLIKIGTLVDSTRTLSILIGSGVSILDGLDIIIQTTTNVVFQKAFKDTYNRIERGSSFGQALQKEAVFPPLIIQMSAVGEQTGHLDETLMKVSKYFESESEIATKTLTTFIEPAILVVLGFGVGFLIFSIITPLYQLTNAIH